jgi:hypothetical protein
MDRIHKIAESIVATRPIRQDGNAIERLVDKVFARIEGISVQYEPLLDTFWFKDTMDIKTVKGESVFVIVQIVSRKGPSDFLVLGGGSGNVVNTRTPIVIVDINGRYSADDFVKNRLRFKRELFEMLSHELTHQADIMKSPSCNRLDCSVGPDDMPDAYYNHPNEVRAYMRGIFEEMRPRLHVLIPKGAGNAIRILLRHNRKWKMVEPHLTDSNKRLIQKGIYQAVQDWMIGEQPGV